MHIAIITSQIGIDMFSFLRRNKEFDKAETVTAPDTVTATDDDTAAAIVDNTDCAAPQIEDTCDDAKGESNADATEHIDTDNMRDDVAQDEANICDDNQTDVNTYDDEDDICDEDTDETDTAINDASTCENADTTDVPSANDTSNICDDAPDTRDESRNAQEDTRDTSDGVVQVDAKDDIYAALRFECGNDMSVTIDDESDTVTISHGVVSDEPSDAQDTERPVGRHYIDADAVLPGDEPARYQGFMTYGRGDADEIADRCPASELDFDAILADYDRADHRMVRDVLDGLYGTMAASGEMAAGDPKPFPVYGGAAMPLNNWSWQDVNSVRKHIAHMPLPVVTGRANVAAGIKVDDNVDVPQADADASDGGSEAMHDAPFVDGDKGGCGVSGGRHFRHADVDDAAGTDGVTTPVTDAENSVRDSDEKDADGSSSHVSSLVDCGNGYFMYVDGGDDTARIDDMVDGKDKTGKSRGKSSRGGAGDSVAAGTSSSISHGMSDAVKIGCIAAMVIARKAARRVR